MEKANQAMKEVEAMEIQAVAIEAHRHKAEKEAIEEKAREVIEVEDDSPVKAEEVDDTKVEGAEGDEEEEVVFVKNKGVCGADTKNLHCHKIGAAAGTGRTTKTPMSPVKKRDSNKRTQETIVKAKVLLGGR